MDYIENFKGARGRHLRENISTVSGKGGQDTCEAISFPEEKGPTGNRALWSLNTKPGISINSDRTLPLCGGCALLFKT